MKSKQRIMLIALALCILTAFSLFAADAEADESTVSYRYDTGDQLFFFDAGVYRPLFAIIPSQDPMIESVIDNTYIGGNAGMGFEAFLNHHVSFGGEISYTFSYAIDKNLYTAVPLSANISYYLMQGDFDLPISLGAGLVYNSFNEESYLSPIFLKTQLGFFWNFNKNWGVGVDVDYWFIPEFYTGANADNTAYMNSASVRLALQYKQ